VRKVNHLFNLKKSTLPKNRERFPHVFSQAEEPSNLQKNLQNAIFDHANYIQCTTEKEYVRSSCLFAGFGVYFSLSPSPRLEKPLSAPQKEERLR
jgi:hypothetical protein